ncbi:MAG: hypothetical protein GWP15_01780 [Nitrospirae bacterium]|nr:hypothetical protein [Nitrospirota bacterium]
MKKIILFLLILLQTSQFAYAADSLTSAPDPSELGEPSEIEIITRPDGTIEYRKTYKIYELIEIPTELFERDKFGYENPILDPSHIKSPSEVSRDPAVIGSNILLAILIFLVVGIACFLFNNVIEENGDEINKFTRKIPLLNLFEKSKLRKNSFTRKVVLLILLIIFGLITAHITPDFNLFEQKNLGILIITVATVVIASYTKDLMRFFLARKWNWPAFFKPNILGLFLAVFCVILSRNLAISPGYLFGIPMGLFIFSEKFERNEGKFEYYSLTWMFLMAVAVWFITPYTKDYEVVHDLSNLLYIILLEGVFFELFPITFLPGKAIYKWSKFAWASLFTAVSFLLLHSLFNPSSTFSAINESPPTTNTLIILGAFVGMSFFVWGVAKLRLNSKRA